MKKRLTIVCLGIVLVASVVLVGQMIYQHWRITSAITKLKDEDAPVEERIKAAARLGAMGPATKEVIPALIWAVQQERSPERSLTSGSLAGQAAHELARIGPPAIPAMIELLEDEDARRRYWGSRREEVTSRIPELFSVLSRVGRPAVPGLIKLLKDEDRRVRGIAADTLERMGPLAEEAIPALMEAANNEEERQHRYKEVNQPLDTLIKIGRPASRDLRMSPILKIRMSL